MTTMMYQDSQQRKRQKTSAAPALNFSIESLMRPAASAATSTGCTASNNNNNTSNISSSNSLAGSNASSCNINIDNLESNSNSSTGSNITISSSNINVNSSTSNHDNHIHNHNTKITSHISNNNSTTTSSTTGTSSNNNSTTRLSQVECQLDNKDMWDKFHSLNTEMIITKTGRRMFPVMKVQFHNLDPNKRYAVSMDIVPVDNKRYRYAYHKSCWQVAGKADPSAEARLYPHPDSPFNGDLLSRQVISFEKVKLTNNEMDKSGHIILNSMHKYQPRVHLVEIKEEPHQQHHNQTAPSIISTQSQHGKSSSSTSSSSSSSASSYYNNQHHHNQHHHHNSHHDSHHNHHHHNSNSRHHQERQQQQQQPQLNIEGYRTFVFPETVFTAVTAYQNQLITKMKIDKNPFAKGFRDSSRLSDESLDPLICFDYMGPSSRRPGGTGTAGGPSGPGSLEAYQLLANNPWYSAAAVAAAAGGGNPFSPMGACSTAQAAQIQATQMWLAAFSACLTNGGAPGGPPPQQPQLHQLGDQQTMIGLGGSVGGMGGCGGGGGGGGGSSSSSSTVGDV